MPQLLELSYQIIRVCEFAGLERWNGLLDWTTGGAGRHFTHARAGMGCVLQLIALLLSKTELNFSMISSGMGGLTHDNCSYFALRFNHSTIQATQCAWSEWEPRFL